ncbi:SAF domain-containing protein [Jatrophihabitans sp. YIM 134969]
MTAKARWQRSRERLSGTPRLVLAVVLLAAGVLVALTATAPPATGPVVVVSRPVAGGVALRPGDVVVAQRALADRPDGALTTLAPALGQRAVGALARGEVVTASRLAPAGLADDLAPGRSLATVTVASARAGVVAVGDLVQVVVPADDTAGPTAGPVTLAEDAQVLAVWPPTDGDDTTTAVLDVDVGSASRLAVLPADLLVGLVIVTA